MTNEKVPTLGTKGRIRHFGRLLRKGADLVDYGMKNDQYPDEEILRLAKAVLEAARGFGDAVDARYQGSTSRRVDLEQTVIIDAVEATVGDQVFETRFFLATDGSTQMALDPAYEVLSNAEIIRGPNPQVRLMTRTPDGEKKTVLLDVSSRLRVFGRSY